MTGSSLTTGQAMADTAQPPAHAIHDRQMRDAILVFIGNIAICLVFFAPEVQGIGDTLRGWDQFNRLFAEGTTFFGPHNQIALRIVMASMSTLLLVALYLLGLIERRVVITYLALPFSAYLATKIRVEFLFFPLALISTRLGWKREVAVLLAILGMSFLLDENNGVILVFYRLAVIVFRAIPMRSILVFLAIGAIVVLDNNIKLLYPIFPSLAVYNWTRDIVNPEFSHFETAIVFLSSMTMSLQPPLDYMFGFTYTCFLLFATFGRRLLSARFYARILTIPEFRAGLLTVMFFTAITHAFQNARYYFFYVPLIGSVHPAQTNKLLILASWPMMFLLVIYYRFYLGL
ncbi:hypothetical protein ACFE33_15725 (plasmid) [Falsihalocynthiibacter sp. SS001]|uniref:hypothetical protein n=1 Tax=Falsihalocynthiibacter sp. SS001 TaxID=3349698 RepID=UPI0036D3EE17